MLQNRFLEPHKITHFCMIPGYLWDRECWESVWECSKIAPWKHTKLRIFARFRGIFGTVNTGNRFWDRECWESFPDRERWELDYSK